MGGDKGRKGFGPRVDSGKAREWRQVHAPTVGVVYLWDKADVGKAGAASMAEQLLRRLGQQAFEPLKAECDEVLHPSLHRGRLAKADGVASDAQVADGLVLHGDGLGKSAGLGAGGWSCGKKACATGVVQVFEDCE
jgi:hypothetical protein